MNEVLLAKARKIEQSNLCKANKIISDINKYIREYNIDFPNEPYILFCESMSLYFDNFKVCHESLDEYWMENDNHIEWYVNQVNNVVVSLITNDVESARIEIGSHDNIILDETGFLNFKKGVTP